MACPKKKERIVPAHLSGKLLSQHLHNAVFCCLIVMQGNDLIEPVVLAQDILNTFGILNSILQLTSGGKI